MKTFTLFIGLLLAAFGAAAQNSGSTGPLTWNYDAGTKTLTVTGTGIMPNYEEPSNRPWHAFKDEIETVAIGNGVTSIGNDAFSNCSKLQRIALPEGLTTIGAYAFMDCEKFAEITLPSSVTTIGELAFSRCTALPAIGVDAANARFVSADGVLYNKAKTELLCYPAGKPSTAFTVPAEVKKIGNDAFSDCSRLKSILLPKGLTTIGKYAFMNCSALQSITIPGTVASIESDAFSSCLALKDVTVAWDTPLAVNPSIFYKVPLTSATLHVPAGKVPAYQAANVWKEFATIVAITTALPDGAEAMGLRIGAAAGKLCFTATQAVEVRVFTPSGSCVAAQLLPAGESALSLPQGIYLVQTGTGISKHAVRD